MGELEPPIEAWEPYDWGGHAGTADHGPAGAGGALGSGRRGVLVLLACPLRRSGSKNSCLLLLSESRSLVVGTIVIFYRTLLAGKIA